MSGHDRSRFVGLSDADFEELKCGICLGVFNAPLVTPCCQQTYCSLCINQWVKTSKTCPNDRKPLNKNKLAIPPRFSTNILYNLMITCDYKESGCEEVLKLGQLSQHVPNCRYNPKNKCRVCNAVKTANHVCGQQDRDVIEKLRTELRTLSESNAKLTASLNQSKNKRIELEKTLMERLRVKDNEIESLRARNSQLESESRGVDHKIECALRDGTDLRKQNDNFFAENNSLKAEIKKLRQHCDTFLEEKEKRIKEFETLEKELIKVKKENGVIKEQLNNNSLDSQREDYHLLSSNNISSEDHVRQVIESARNCVDNPVIIKCKLSNVTQLKVLSIIKEGLTKYDSLREIAEQVRTEMNALRRGIVWNTLIYSNDCCYAINYSNDNLFVANFGKLRIKLISAYY